MVGESDSVFAAELAGFLNVENFSSFIVAAFGAGAVRHFLFVTVGAFRE
jgi:hypothetical protein